MNCQRLIHGDASYRTQLGEECGKPAAWTFHFKYPCVCKDYTCPAHFNANEGYTPLCHEHRAEFMSEDTHRADNLVPEDEQWQRVYEPGCGNRIRFSELPMEAQVAWDRDMKASHWHTETCTIFDFSENPWSDNLKRYVAWSPRYPGPFFAAYIVAEERWLNGANDKPWGRDEFDKYLKEHRDKQVP
jgi:hypothetical protein